MRITYKERLEREVTRYLAIKEDILALKKDLTEVDVAMLAGKLMGAPKVIYDEDFIRVKDKDSYRPYLPGIFLTIDEISGFPTNPVIKVLRKGFSEPIIIRKQQAIAFLSLLALKFGDADRDATFGFHLEDFENKTDYLLTEAINKENPIDVRALENLKVKLKPSGLREAVQRLPEGTYRFAVSPLRIMFEEEARSVFDRLTHHAYASFCKRYDFDPTHLRDFVGES
jgi:hypothetical protein